MLASVAGLMATHSRLTSALQFSGDENTQALSFGNLRVPSPEKTVTPDSEFSGIVALAGEEGESIRVELPEQATLMHSSGAKLSVRSFAVSGDLSFNDKGPAEIRVGATLGSIRSDNPEGCYTGSATLRIVGRESETPVELAILTCLYRTF